MIKLYCPSCMTKNGMVVPYHHATHFMAFRRRHRGGKLYTRRLPLVQRWQAHLLSHRFRTPKTDPHQYGSLLWWYSCPSPPPSKPKKIFLRLKWRFSFAIWYFWCLYIQASTYHSDAPKQCLEHQVSKRIMSLPMVSV